MLSVATAKVVCDWSWHNNKIDSRTGVTLGGLARKIEKDMTGNMVGGMVTTTLCDRLP
jgi:hypothetical protein